ncbi:MAG: release factor glutamine methyltransferase [Flavobacteriales bacterium]|jgi:release factor glutamine methyltransferase
MTVQDFRDTFISTLSGIYPPEEVHALLYRSLEHYLGLSRVEVALSRKQPLKDAQRLLLEATLERLSKQEPIQYILGSTEFYDLDFLVNTTTLIPRPETEELVRWIVGDVQVISMQNKALQYNPEVLDIGTGSGCIAISLAKNLPTAIVQGIDVSLQALEIAVANAKRNQVVVNFYQQDILNTDRLKGTYDIIVSNPPYVRELEKAEIEVNVLAFEPHSALFVSDQDPLIFYRKIAELAVKYLNPKGSLFLEINQYLGQETVALLKAIGFTQVELKQDMFGKDRMIKAQKD